MTQKYPGYYTLKKFIIYPEGGGKREYDLSLLIPSFSIIESIDNDCIRGSAKVIDSAGLLEGYPLRGEERIYLEVDDALGNTRIFHLFLWRIDNVQVSDINKQLMYDIHFISYQRYKAGLKRVIAAYNLPPNQIAFNIFRDYYQLTRKTNPSDNSGRSELPYVEDEISKQLVYEELRDPIHVTIPNYTPMQAMQFLANRSYSDSSPSCLFRFFESANYFYFISDETLYKKAIEEKRVHKFTSVSIPTDGSTIFAQMSNFETISLVKRTDTLDDLIDGSYKSRCHVFDINYGIYEEFDYDFMEKRNIYFKDTNVPNDRHSETFISNTFNYENAKKFYIVKTYDEDSAGSVMGNQNYPQIITNRTAYQNHIQSLTVSGTAPGRLDITCGDIIELKMLKVISANQIEENAQLTGKYIVRQVNRSFDQDTYKNTYTLMKKDWEVSE